MDNDKLERSLYMSPSPLPGDRWCQVPLPVRDRLSPLSWRDLADPHPKLLIGCVKFVGLTHKENSCPGVGVCVSQNCSASAIEENMWRM